MANLVDGHHVGEVIQATSVLLTVQCSPRQDSALSFPEPPALGAFVYASAGAEVRTAPSVAEEGEIDPFLTAPIPKLLKPELIIGIVNYVQTASIDPGRRAVALGIGSEEELRKSQPQIFELLTTEFQVMLTSCTDSTGRVLHYLPARPPRLHSFVYECDSNQLAAITEDFGYLRSILNRAGSSVVPVDELAAAAIVAGWSVRSYDDSYLVKAGKAVLRSVLDDYDRFESIMHRVTLTKG